MKCWQISQDGEKRDCLLKSNTSHLLVSGAPWWNAAERKKCAEHKITLQIPECTAAPTPLLPQMTYFPIRKLSEQKTTYKLYLGYFWDPLIESDYGDMKQCNRPKKIQPELFYVVWFPLGDSLKCKLNEDFLGCLLRGYYTKTMLHWPKPSCPVWWTRVYDDFCGQM